MFQKIQLPTKDKPQVPLTKFSVSNQTSRIHKSYLFESIALLWSMLFYLMFVMVWTKGNGPKYYYNSENLSSTAIALTAIFFSAPLCMVSLGAATRAIQNNLQELHGPAQDCCKVARAFFHISWILFVAVQICLHQMKN